MTAAVELARPTGLIALHERSAAVPARYRDLMNRPLATRLEADDFAEDLGVLASDDRLTCYTYRTWIHRRAASPQHVNVVTQHRWCRRCQLAIDMIVDELTGTAAARCPGCRRGALTSVDHALVKACAASLARACAGRNA